MLYLLIYWTHYILLDIDIFSDRWLRLKYRYNWSKGPLHLGIVFIFIKCIETCGAFLTWPYIFICLYNTHKIKTSNVYQIEM